jgi:hypothetical protein
VFADAGSKVDEEETEGIDTGPDCRTCVVDRIPCLFGQASTLRGTPGGSSHRVGLVFAKAFQIATEETHNKVDYRVMSKTISAVEGCAASWLELS